MKKSKIIIPALAMIAFSTAASISGAVAWFTASRQASINAGTYAVVKTNSDLACTVTAGIGVKTVTNPTDASQARVVSLTDGTKTNKLTDGSFNHSSKKIYTPDSTGKAFDSTKGEITLASATEENMTRATLADGDVYTVVTWKADFSVNFGALPGNIGLFLDTAQSSFSVGTNVTAKTGKGFRMAFIPTDTTNGVTKVYANLQTSALCKHVNDTSSMAGIAYTGNTLIASDTTVSALPQSEISASDAAARADFFGTFVNNPGEIVHLEYTVVCWFEGTDPEIINREAATDYQSVTANLVFKALNLTSGS